MNVIACGLNSYLGKACLQHLQSDGFTVHGLIRDQLLLKKKLQFTTDVQLYNFDIVQYNFIKGINLQLPPSELAFYFTQTPELHDIVGANYELLSIRNYIQFCQYNKCNRIVYVGTLYDRKHLNAIEKLFHEFKITYTIVLKDVAIGSGTSFEDFMIKMMRNKLIYLYKPTTKITFNPITLEDLMHWLRSVDWESKYVNEIVTYSGDKEMEIEEVMKLYKDKLAKDKNHKIISIQNKHLAKYLNLYLSKVPYDQYIEYIHEIIDRTDIANFKTVKSKTQNPTSIFEHTQASV